MRTYHRAYGGKPYIWWLTNRHQVRNASALGAILIALFLLSRWDAHEFANDAELARARTAALQREVDLIHTLPSTVFVMEGRTPEEVAVKLARTAGELDYHRYKLTHKQK